MGNSSFPDSRRLYSQPRMVTSLPSCWPIFSMVTTLMAGAATAIPLSALRGARIFPPGRLSGKHEFEPLECGPRASQRAGQGGLDWHPQTDLFLQFEHEGQL